MSDPETDARNKRNTKIVLGCILFLFFVFVLCCSGLAYVVFNFDSIVVELGLL